MLQRLKRGVKHRLRNFSISPKATNQFDSILKILLKNKWRRQHFNTLQLSHVYPWHNCSTTNQSDLPFNIATEVQLMGQKLGQALLCQRRSKSDPLCLVVAD
ncbi:MAG: hypothetical protein ACK50S_00740 [bacterium]|jgi:hypothetical protein